MIEQLNISMNFLWCRVHAASIALQRRLGQALYKKSRMKLFCNYINKRHNICKRISFLQRLFTWSWRASTSYISLPHKTHTILLHLLSNSSTRSKRAKKKNKSKRGRNRRSSYLWKNARRRARLNLR